MRERVATPKRGLPRPSRCCPGQRNLFICRHLPPEHPAYRNDLSLKAGHPRTDGKRKFPLPPGHRGDGSSRAKKDSLLPDSLTERERVTRRDVPRRSAGNGDDLPPVDRPDHNAG